jgi:hypothetical protein
METLRSLQDDPDIFINKDILVIIKGPSVNLSKFKYQMKLYYIYTIIDASVGNFYIT